ncbi:hypothetical protein GUJ93_ZPchr0013g36154 [Zizania palustris]|uniref:Uncharacterized protein n=1 Tax=Zizania palustris TaxID=103762 RepID=A0A8J5WV96_ZIZPA|nr:hypothetical protein GUJ93_ZPchr0013g36154 [Zizania palustris]
MSTKGETLRVLSRRRRRRRNTYDGGVLDAKVPERLGGGNMYGASGTPMTPMSSLRSLRTASAPAAAAATEVR